MKRFIDKVVIVTGAADGIGRATVLEFAAEGGRVVVADRNSGRGLETVAAIDASGGHARFLEVDVANAASVRQMIERTLDAYGLLDIAFNDAGISSPNGSLADLPDALPLTALESSASGLDTRCVRRHIEIE